MMDGEEEQKHLAEKGVFLSTTHITDRGKPQLLHMDFVLARLKHLQQQTTTTIMGLLLCRNIVS